MTNIFDKIWTKRLLQKRNKKLWQNLKTQKKYAVTKQNMSKNKMKNKIKINWKKIVTSKKFNKNCDKKLTKMWQKIDEKIIILEIYEATTNIKLTNVIATK